MKEEYLIRIMETKKLDAYIIQETHLTGDYVTIMIGENNYYMIHDGPENNQDQEQKEESQ